MVLIISYNPEFNFICLTLAYVVVLFSLIRSNIILLSFIFATIAFSLSCVSVFGCSFVEFVSPVPVSYESTSSTRTLETTYNQSGIWSYKWWDSSSKEYTCHPYPDTIEIDPKWRAARIMSALAIILGPIFLISVPVYLVLNYCYPALRRKQNQYPYQLMGTVCLLACVCETFSLIFLKSNACQNNSIFNLMNTHSCIMSSGATCTYVAILFWFIAGVFMMLPSKNNTVTADQRGEEDANLEESFLQEFT